MKSEYDFSKMKSRKTPYASKLKKSVTIRLGEDVIENHQRQRRPEKRAKDYLHTLVL